MERKTGKEKGAVIPEQLNGFKSGYSAEAVYKGDYKEGSTDFVNKINEFLERANAKNVSIVGLLPLGENSEVKSSGGVTHRMYSDTTGILFIVHNPQKK